MTRPTDLIWMRRALQLAAMAEGQTSPNPMVGAVVVHEKRIIGEGYHLKAGTPHAEVHAVNAVKDRSLLAASTIYVTLEPCSHHGKTPPCTDLIISSGIRRVVIGTPDTNPLVGGRGIQRLRQAGIEVVTGVLEEECRHLNRRFFTWHEKKRPYVILKWARSADGFIDLCRKPGDPVEPNWITGMAERVLVHRWRAAEDAILAGGGTIRADNPALNVRFWSGRNPVRVIVSRSGAMNRESAAFDGEAKTIIFTCNRDLAIPGATIRQLTAADRGNPAPGQPTGSPLGNPAPGQPTGSPLGNPASGQPDGPAHFPGEVLASLYDDGIQSVFIEGGAFIIRSFAEAGLWDEARRFTGQVSFGQGISDPFPEFTPEKTVHFDKSILEFAYHF